MTYLCRLATKYGTDKAGFFTPVYDLFFRDRCEEVTSVLEIGIGTKEAMQHVPNYNPGASLFMWGDYFPNAHVFGADIVPSNLPGCYQLDQGSEAQLLRFGKDLGPFDLVVDDGSHDPYHQILGAKVLVPFLKPGGLYIIEDVNNFDVVMQGLEMPALCISYQNPNKPTARCMVIRG